MNGTRADSMWCTDIIHTSNIYMIELEFMISQ